MPAATQINFTLKYKLMKNQLRKLRLLSALLPLSLLSVQSVSAQTIPVPDHVVLVVMENYGYNFIIGSTSAPYINSFLADTNTANFSGFYAITHPSQPNYLYLYSGNAQGNSDDNIPAGIPFTTANLGAELIAASKTFVTYSENLPNIGFNGGTASGNYVRKHNPVANWMGTGTNQVPTSVNQPYTAFPNAANYASLPTVSYIIPNNVNDMHDGTFPSNITIGDTWLKNHVDSFKQWALTHNSLLIITFDEDNGLSSNRIPTIFYGPMVKGGTYSNRETLINLLGTIETMYGLGHAGAPFSSSIPGTDTPITYCWKRVAADTTTPAAVNNYVANYTFKVSPNPATNQVTFHCNTRLNSDVAINVFDINGRFIGKYIMSNDELSVNTTVYAQGMYFYKVLDKSRVLDEGKFIIEGH